jgi:hypothetical protein
MVGRDMLVCVDRAPEETSGNHSSLADEQKKQLKRAMLRQTKKFSVFDRGCAPEISKEETGQLLPLDLDPSLLICDRSHCGTRDFSHWPNLPKM